VLFSTGECIGGGTGDLFGTSGYRTAVGWWECQSERSEAGCTTTYCEALESREDRTGRVGRGCWIA
jgi:hypothetical protein